MATEKLLINGDDSGWPTGSTTDVDEGIASADAAVMSTTIDDDVVIFDLGASAITDADTVTNVDITVYGRTLGASGKDTFTVDLLIGGTGQGSQVTGNLTGSHASYTLSNILWDSDWTAAQLAGMQVSVQATQTGKGTAATWELDTLDVDITYTEASGSTINEVTITGANNYAAATDDSVELRQRARQQSDSAATTDSANLYRIHGRSQLEYIQKVSDAAWIPSVFSYAYRVRSHTELDTHTVTDPAPTATYVPGGGAVNNVTITGANNYAATTDTKLELRLRDRQQFDDAVVEDDKTATYIPIGSVINNVTLDDLDSVALTDNAIELRLRDRGQSDSAVVTDPVPTATYVPGSFVINNITLSDNFIVSDAVWIPLVFSYARRERNRTETETSVVTDSALELRERSRGQSDSAEVTDDSIELRLRDRSQSDSIVLLDDKTAQYVPPGSVTYSVTIEDLDSASTTDSTLQLRLRNREDSDAVDLVDAFNQYSNRSRSQSDSIDVDDVASRWLLNQQQPTETIDPSDDSIEGRLRNRLLSDAVVVLDDANAQYVPPGSVIYNRTLQDLDSIGVSDVDAELRLRDRSQSDNAAVEDDKTATYIPVGTIINNVTLQDLDSVAVTDQLVSLRERVRNVVTSLDAFDSLSSTALRQRIGADSLSVTDSTLKDIVFSLLDGLDTSDSSAELRLRYRQLLESIEVSDNVSVTLDTDISNVTLSDSLVVTDSVTATKNVISGTFQIYDGVEALSVEHGLALQIYASHGLSEETS